jgi:hypothetical protein
MSTRTLAEYEESCAFQLARFSETAKKYLANPELAEFYREEAQGHFDLAATLHSLGDANS